MTERRALSIRQPWTHLILAGAKQTENRTWSTSYRGPVLLHAGKRLDPAGFDLADHLGVEVPNVFPSGAFVGEATLVDVHRDAGCCRPWGEPAVWHWVFAEPRELVVPLFGPGKLGLWRVQWGEWAA